MSDNIKHVSDATYEADVLKADKPVIVDFWAPWCGPCRMLAPLVEQLADAYVDKIVVAKMNTDENQDIPGKLGIRGIPTLIMYRNGQEVDRMVGFAPFKVLQERVEAKLLGS